MSTPPGEFALGCLAQRLQQAGAWRIAIELLRCLGDVLRVIWRSQRLRQRWTWRRYDAHLDQSLSEIRELFGIRIV